MAPLLGYWKIRGLAQSIRFVLEFAEAEYEEKRYEFGPPPNFDRSHWMNEKFTLGLDFPNLPYLIDGELKLTQTNTILRYLARKYKLDGKTEGEIIRQDLVLDVCADMRRSVSTAMYAFAGDYETGRANYIKELPSKLKPLSTFLGDRNWFTGNNLNFVDFVVYELLYVNNQFVPGCLNDYKNLQDLMTRFEALPAIKKYIASGKYLARPLNGRMAKFGGE